MVECLLPKQVVASSSLVTRSITRKQLFAWGCKSEVVGLLAWAGVIQWLGYRGGEMWFRVTEAPTLPK